MLLAGGSAMKTVEISGKVEEDGELRIRSAKLKSGQQVRVKLVIGDPAEPRHSWQELRGILKGTWGSAEAVDRYLEEERDSGER